AEDGIRDFHVTGVQTCALPILVREEMGDRPLIASGGIMNGLDGAKSLALGADFVGFGRAILKEATQSAADVIELMEIREMELRMSMFGVGTRTIQELKNTPRLKRI